mmetsp:Transcript_37170/g.68601  ORF Transcript_37170/g.68601 Transcript_37170/m.68601 type:complete len:122 (-) Transcript_37170:78-443(-)
MRAAGANYLLNDAVKAALDSVQRTRARSSCLDPDTKLAYNPRLRDTVDYKTSLIIDLAIEGIKERDNEFTFTIFGCRVTRLTIYSVGSSLGLLIASSVIGSVGQVIAKKSEDVATAAVSPK